MKEKNVMVSGRWNEFKMIPESAYEVFILQYRKFPSPSESYSNSSYDGAAVFHSIKDAEDYILHYLRTNEMFKGMQVKQVNFYDDQFIYTAIDFETGNWTSFKIIPSRFS